ncbi:RIP metalloprotease RseP [Pseudodesulfovibrio senegalensis]|uniref:Zinc metalloprotease n=1 Tax=Pseudodesulfovibrio senegalensis TaxID=1721087 RepID=A0A6N6N4F5_9BACT|nr:RIP metalloprotease RseP [Pseudodesulfovibrio senegalensis]KAB1442390.1 RIP metalloprotease RseP [Pseudodesulfovibrio senegalensis]
MTSIIAVIVVLGGLIFFHELGHFVVARLLGMGVKAFSLGFGPRIFGFRSGNTDYRLSAFPLGGYVQLAGESGEPEEDDLFPENKLFSARPPWQRMLVVAAGPVFNFLLAFLCFWGLLLANGEMVMAPTVGEVVQGSPAQTAGIQSGDTVLSINGLKVTYWRDMVEEIRKEGIRPLQLEVDRNGTTERFTLTARLESHKNLFGEDVKIPIVGVKASGEMTSIPVEGSGFVPAMEQTWYSMKMVVMGFVKLVERIVPLDTIGGPIFLMQAVHEGTKSGINELIYLTAIISINLGIINLLPIPVLDGGHIVYFTLEMIMRRPVSDRWRALATRIGIMFLLALMTLAIYNDIRRLLS